MNKKVSPLHHTKRDAYLAECVEVRLVSRQRLYEKVKGECGELTDLAYTFLIQELKSKNSIESYIVGHYVGNEIAEKYNLDLPPITDIFQGDILPSQTSGNTGGQKQSKTVRHTSLNAEIYTLIHLILHCNSKIKPAKGSLLAKMLGYLDKMPLRDCNEYYINSLISYVNRMSFIHPDDLVDSLAKRYSHAGTVKKYQFPLLAPYFEKANKK